jgi:hypothetical protein
LSPSPTRIPLPLDSISGPSPETTFDAAIGLARAAAQAGRLRCCGVRHAAMKLR